MTGPELEVYLGRVAALGCAICRRLGYGPTPAQIHHQRAGKGKAERAPDDEVVPLCEPHHLGPTGIHGLGTKAFPRVYGVTEAELVEQTRREVEEGERSALL